MFLLRGFRSRLPLLEFPSTECRKLQTSLVWGFHIDLASEKFRNSLQVGSRGSKDPFTWHGVRQQGRVVKRQDSKIRLGAFKPTLCPVPADLRQVTYPHALKFSHLKMGIKTVPTSWSVKSFSRVWLYMTSWTAARRAPLSMWFPRQECWSGLPFPPPGYLLDPGIEPGSTTWQVDSLWSEPPGKLLHRF